MSRYEVSSFDLCVQGFERLRSHSEFILVAYPAQRWGWKALRDAWLQEIEACDRGDSFDYEAARRVVLSYCAKLRKEWEGRNMRAIYGEFATTSEDSEGCMAFLYVRDTQA